MPNEPDLTLAEIEEALEVCAAAVEPKCPACGAAVGRPKCLFELNPVECPRHAIRAEWLLKKRAFGILARTLLPRALAELKRRREDSARLDWLIENRSTLWNSQFRDRAAIDAAFAGEEKNDGPL